MHDSRKITIALIFFCVSICLKAQKPPIDSTTFGTWPFVNKAAISNNGRYVYYEVPDIPLAQTTLFLRSVDSQWQISFNDITSPAISQDSRRAVFQRKDTLFLVGLGNSTIEHIMGIEGVYELLPLGIDDDLLVYKLKSEPKTVVMRRMSSGEQRSYSSVEKYWYNSLSGTFLLLTKDTSQPESIYHLKKTMQHDKETEDIWQGPDVKDLVFNSDGTQFAFNTLNAKGGQSLWYYYTLQHKALNLLTDSSKGTDNSLKIASIVGISKGNEKVYLLLKSEQALKNMPGPGVDIYSYSDPKLQSQQLLELKEPYPLNFKAVVNISDGHLVQLEHPGKEVVGLNPSFLPDKYALLVETGPGDFGKEWYWNKKAQASIYLMSLADGSKKLLYKELHDTWDSFFYLSPDEKYVLFFDPKTSNYYSLDIAVGILTNTTEMIKTTWTQKNLEVFPALKSSPFGIGGFTSDGKSALIYDQYDIYKVDLAAKAMPVNVTHFVGHKQHIIFRLPHETTCYNPDAKVILEAFNDNNKDQGYYSLVLNRSQGLDSLSMLPVKRREAVIKARNSNAYLVFLENTTSTRNVFYSSDLKHFIPLSNIHPEEKYNWITSELVTWQRDNGVNYHGVLYKPENFDPHKKYPLIFVYYEQKSDELHEFQRPIASGDDINIPFFVSNGYLVFTPDIHYTVGFPGRSALNAIVSAADALSKRPYIDKSKMGLSGISFGGFETNYIVTHTTRFAAAMSNSGMTDFISAYGSIIGDGTSRQRAYEIYRDRMGTTPWQRPDLYIENSPVLRANFVRTPLLMIANNGDWDVPHEQGVEFYTALRRLERKVWMLQYDGMGHGVWGRAAKDFTVRVFQFFNYYLKGELPPRWMTRGIPAELKGIDNGFQLDTSGATP